MSSGGNYWVHLWGGLGDFLKMYYTHNQWRRLENIKERNPNIKIKALVYSLNPSAKDLIEHHPALDEIYQPEGGLIEVRTKGIASYAGGYTPLVKETHLIRDAVDTRTRIYLSNEDKEQVNNIISSIPGKFVIIHPFSAMPPHVLTSRSAMEPSKYIPIIEGLAKKGITSIVLGASKEELEYESEYTRNLIGKTSVRAALALVKRSSGFIGTNSCFMCGAMLENRPCFVITSYFWEDKAFKNGFIAERLKNIRGHFVFLPMDRSTADYDKIAKEAIAWFK